MIIFISENATLPSIALQKKWSEIFGKEIPSRTQTRNRGTRNCNMNSSYRIVCTQCVDQRTVRSRSTYAHISSYAIRFKHMQCSHSNVEIGWKSTGWVSIPANVTLWHRLPSKSICTTEASDYWLGAKYSVIYVLLPINKII